MDPLALLKQLAFAIRELVAPSYRPELHYMRGPGPAYARAHRAETFQRGRR